MRRSDIVYRKILEVSGKDSAFGGASHKTLYISPSGSRFLLVDNLGFREDEMGCEEAANFSKGKMTAKKFLSIFGQNP
jgi:hypothetical protein